MSSRAQRRWAWRSSRFDGPFDRLRVVSEVEPLKAPSWSRGQMDCFVVRFADSSQ